jgi:hypothetical protein
MLLLQLKDGISAQSRDVAEDESGQSYYFTTSNDLPVWHPLYYQTLHPYLYFIVSIFRHDKET